MEYKNLSKIFLATSIMGCMFLAPSASNAAPEKTTMSIEKPSNTQQHFSALEKNINVLDRAKFDVFKMNVENGLKHTAEIIPELKQKNEVLPASVKEDVMTIEKTLPKIKTAETPEELIKEEAIAFNAATSALKTINNNNKNEKRKSTITTKLDSAEKMTKSLTVTNYKVKTKQIFQAINYSMKEIQKSLK